MPQLPHTLARRKLLIRGIVQGVGFHPFVYRLAQTLTLAGYVLNSSEDVVIEIEGETVSLDCFLRQLRNTPPALTYIEEVTVTHLEPTVDTSFDIHESIAQAETLALR